MALTRATTFAQRASPSRFPEEGVIPNIEQRYHHYRKQGEANAWFEDYLKKMMVEVDCPDCHGTRLKAVRRGVSVGGRSLPDLGAMHLDDLRAFVRDLQVPEAQRAVASILAAEIGQRLDLLVDIGLDYLSLDRRSGTLSGGEAQRIRLSTQIGSGLMGMLYVLDEPSIGLHPRDNARMIATLRRLVDLGNTVVVVEHDAETIEAADYLVELGPGPGVHGGRVVCAGPPDEALAHPDSLTGAYLTGRRAIAVPSLRRTPDRWIEIRGARHNNLKNVDVRFPLGVLCCVTGPSGSGKSSLVSDTLYAKLVALKHDSRVLSGAHDAIAGADAVDDVINIDQAPIGRSSRSNPATYIGIYDAIRKLFASTALAKARGYTASRFSFNVRGGRCEQCQGEGTVTTAMSFMPDVSVPCPACRGARYDAETLEVTYRDHSMAQVLDLSVEEGAALFGDHRLVSRKLAILCALGLGYLKIGHPAPLLSGGEAQRVKLANQLGKVKRGKHLLYVLDEPTTGLHLADIDKLLASLDRLVQLGHTVLVIEHHLDVVKTADWVIDLGPDGGHAGGEVVAAGTPDQVAACAASPTGRFLAAALAGTQARADRRAR